MWVLTSAPPQTSAPPHTYTRSFQDPLHAKSDSMSLLPHSVGKLCLKAKGLHRSGIPGCGSVEATTAWASQDLNPGQAFLLSLSSLSKSVGVAECNCLQGLSCGIWHDLTSAWCPAGVWGSFLKVCLEQWSFRAPQTQPPGGVASWGSGCCG